MFLVVPFQPNESTWYPDAFVYALRYMCQSDYSSVKTVPSRKHSLFLSLSLSMTFRCGYCMRRLLKRRLSVSHPWLFAECRINDGVLFVVGKGSVWYCRDPACLNRLGKRGSLDRLRLFFRLPAEGELENELTFLWPPTFGRFCRSAIVHLPALSPSIPPSTCPWHHSCSSVVRRPRPPACLSPSDLCGGGSSGEVAGGNVQVVHRSCHVNFP